MFALHCKSGGKRRHHPFDKLYSYLVPPDFSESLWPGSIVLVPFGRGNHPRMAVVLEVGTEEAPDPR